MSCLTFVRSRLPLWLVGSFAAAVCGQNVVINEIMYHPASQNPREEYVEIYNRAVTNVDVSGWKFTKGIDFTFPSNTVLQAGNYLVVAAHRESFTNKYPAVTNVLGDFVIVRTTNIVGFVYTNCENTLSNTREEVQLENASGNTIDSVTYADEGDWAQRQRGFDDRGRRGWKWSAPHDGLGSSLELVNAAMPNEHGQNWTYSSLLEGSPGAANSVVSANIAPMILDVAHFPVVPRSTNSVSVTARIINESASGITVQLHWRVDALAPPLFTVATMFDDGAHGDGLANDGIYAASIPTQANNAVIEFYVHATDGEGNARAWPAPALPAADDPGGSPANIVNALYQVDDSALNDFVASGQPVFKMILTEAERAELAGIPCSGSQNTDAEMNATFIALDGQGTDVRYQNGVRNRGNSSRCANPPNYRISFPSDRPWRDIGSLNLNTVQVYLQHFGSTLAVKSGAVGAYSRAVKVRVNNTDRANSGSPMFGSYAANEAFNAEWADNHFPSDGGGNAYRAQRNIDPSEFDYRGEDPNSYRNTYFKESNVSEDDWRDMIVMHNVMGLNGTVPFTTENARQVVNVEQWLTHLAVMSLVGNSESGLNSGHNDDYFMYRGVNDPRFILVFHDLDQLFGLAGQPFPPDDTIWGATFIHGSGQGCRSTCDNDGSGRMMDRFMHWPDFEPLYYATLQRLLDTTFSKPQFDALLEQTLGGYATPGAMNNIRTWMDARRSYVQSVIDGFVPPKFIPPVATISGEPRNPSPSRNASLTVGGVGITHYMFQLNNGSFSAETPIATPIGLSSLPQGSTNTVYVVGKSTNGTWQSTSAPTVSKVWVVNTNTPTLRLNEVLASNNGSVLHSGTTPDAIELFNDGTASVNLTGLRLTDDKDQPDKFTFPAGTTLAAGAYLTVYANNPDGTAGLHTGFSLDPDGDQVYLFDRATNANAVLDSVRFGMQITDLSMGRTGAGSTWVLSQPSFGSANVAQALGDDSNLKVNEWLASGGAQSDFIEIYNPNAQPVALGGLFLTDEPIGAPALHRIADLSFVAANGFVVFTADGDENDPAHVGFQLPSEIGEIGLFSAILQPIDCVIYGPQTEGVSMGKCPDGAFANKALTLPTPGFQNACPVAPPGPITIPLMAFEHPWRYDESGTDLLTAWIDPAYNDSAWLAGSSFLATTGQGGGTDNWPAPVRTTLTVNSTKWTFYFRTTFTNSIAEPVSALEINHLIDDGAVFYLNGQELYRYNMPQGAVTFFTPAAQNILPANFSGPITVPAALLQPGVNHLAVEVHQPSSTSIDIGLGFTLSAVIVTNSAASAGVVINEVLADNASMTEPDGSTPDWVEIYNPSDTTVDLSDMSLSDSTLNPRRWVFPAASILPAQGYFRVRFDGDLPRSTTNTGWGLKTTGDSVYLFNRLADGGGLRDAMVFGLQIPDFSIARLSDGSRNLALPTIGSANIAATLADPRQLKINEWMANPLPGDDDFFEIYNPGSQPVALGGLWLTDDLSARNKHRIANLSFIGAITNGWTEFKADGNTASGADHVNFSLRAAGEAVGISLPDLTLIDSISFIAQVEGVSSGRLPDGFSNVVAFVTTASPGNANYLLLSNVVVNEALTHSDLPLEDAIELRNLTGASVNIGDWWLSDAQSEPRKYRIPAGTILPANGFAVFYENQFNNPDTAAVPFSLSSARGDQIYLSMVNSNGALAGYRAVAEFDAAANGVSFGRYVNSAGSAEFVAMTQRSFGVDNPGSVTEFRAGAGKTNPYPVVGPLVFTEIMYHPPLLGTNDNTRDEFLEIRNVATTNVTLFDASYPTNRWRLRGGVDFDFPGGVTIAPGGMLLIVGFDPLLNPSAAAAFKATYGLSNEASLLGPWSGKLDNGGERIELQRPDAPQLPPSADAGLVPYIVVERIIYSDMAPWTTDADGSGQSLQRVSNSGYGNDPTNWVAATPSPQPGSAGSLDSDNDGMLDAWERMHGLVVGVNDASLDADGDGMTNLQEYLADTDPQSDASKLAIAISLTPANAARLQFTANANISYTLQHRPSLSTGAWLTLQSVPAAPGNRTIVITNAVPSGPRFYRVTVP